MKRWGWFGILVAVGVGIAVAWWWTAGAPSTAQAANLLANPGFEGMYTERGAGEVKVAESWHPWYLEGASEIPGIEGGGSASVNTGRPEYRAATRAIDAYRVRNGDAAQMWFSFSRTHYAGLLQQVAVAKGNTYRASVWAQGWCSNSDSNTRECPGDRLYISIGIDPDGGTWYKSRAIVWTQWQAVSGAYQQFQSLPVVANKERVTVYIASAAKWPLKHMDLYVDDASLTQVSQADCPTPAPMPTPQPCPTAGPGDCQCVTLPGLQAELGKLHLSYP